MTELERITIRDRSSGCDAEAQIVAARGAIVARWRVDGRELLYLDEATLADPAKNVRGGVPVLFPSPGKLTGDAWARFGRHGVMKQHGFGRALPWTPIVDTRASDRDARAVGLRLDSSDATRAQYPWAFVARLPWSVRGPVLRLSLTVENTGADALGSMPFGFGLHPYFAVAQADKAATRIETTATRAFDNVTKKEIALPVRDGAPFVDLDVDEADVHLLDHASHEASMALAGGDRIVVRGSPELRHWVVWTLRGKDFVCLEPWTSPGDALNTGDRLLHVPPMGSLTLWIELELRRAR